MRTILCCLVLMLFGGAGYGAQRWNGSEHWRDRIEHRRMMREFARERQALKREAQRERAREHQRLRQEYRERHRMLHGYRRHRVV